jgi:chromosome segregation ATPase
VLLAEQKAIEDERHRIAIELAERRNKVKNLRIKYESLVQKAHGSEDGETEHSQAYYVIKASQEREELQRKGDELSGKINEAEKKLKGLQNTLLSLTNTNINLAAKIGQKGVTKSELAQK